MSKRKRRHLTADFKARVAKEALEKEKTIQQIAQENDIAPVQVSTWKKELEERFVEIFGHKGGRDEAISKPSCEKEFPRSLSNSRQFGRSKIACTPFPVDHTQGSTLQFRKRF